MADQKKIVVEQMQAAIGDFSAKLDELEQVGKQFQNTIATLGATWTGSASTAYAGAAQRFTDGYNKSVQILEDLRQSTGSATSFHVDAEDHRASAINGLAMPVISVN